MQKKFIQLSTKPGYMKHNGGLLFRKISKNEYEFNKRYTLFQRIFNWVMFSRVMNVFKTGAEIALL